jgi:hypothetical protein
MFQQELEFFKANQADLVERYAGKILVIKESSVVGVYDTNIEAYDNALKEFELGSFMIQPCKAGEDAYTVTISTLGMIKTKA